MLDKRSHAIEKNTRIFGYACSKLYPTKWRGRHRNVSLLAASASRQYCYYSCQTRASRLSVTLFLSRSHSSSRLISVSPSPVPRVFPLSRSFSSVLPLPSSFGAHDIFVCMRVSSFSGPSYFPLWMADTVFVYIATPSCRC